MTMHLAGRMVFGGKADVRGFLAKMSNSLSKHSKLEYEGDDPEELKVENMAQSFISNHDLEHWNPGKGTANLEVLGESKDGAFDIGFVWDSAEGANKSQANFLTQQLADSAREPIF